MSVNDSAVESASATESTDSPSLRCASYMGCRFCEEGSLVFDAEIGKSRCRTCGKID
ncbi:hypothetical protein [Salinibaculum rarum]|uniref:hypothetical protein n=1 Tax=Salinibaculum rarum TaxID=3058903 RepID=UPI002660038A|nr:hypothetical protein [Salinibaculum sp. KK48]